MLLSLSVLHTRLPSAMRTSEGTKSESCQECRLQRSSVTPPLIGSLEPADPLIPVPSLLNEAAQKPVLSTGPAVAARGVLRQCERFFASHDQVDEAQVKIVRAAKSNMMAQ